MIKVVNKPTPEKYIDFEDIISFSTKNYIGLWNMCSDKFVLLYKSDDELCMVEIPNFDTFEELYEAVYEETEEYIEYVSDKCRYKIELV